MMGFLTHLWRVLHNNVRESAKRGSLVASLLTLEPPRSGKWRTVEHEHLAIQDRCAACGTSESLNVHHIRSFATEPALELVLSNLITLCMGKHECHIRIGHGGSFAKGGYNPNVVLDAALVRKDPSRRPEIELRAKAARVV